MKISNISVIIAIYLTTFLAAIEGTIVSTAMPIITDHLSGAHLFSWVNTIYLLAMVVATPIFGKCSDLYGRKLMITIGIMIFIVGSALSGLAWSMSSLIIFRAIQGLGGASLITLPMVIITDLYEGEIRYKIQGWLSSIWGIAGILGPLVGGLLVDYVSWRSIFYLNVPFACVSLLLIYRSLSASSRKGAQLIDWKGIITFSIGILILLFGVNGIFEQELPGQKLLYGTYIAIGIFILIWFVTIEKKAKEPFIPLVIFSNNLFRFSIIAGFVLSLINVAIIFYVPLWMQHVKGYSATSSGFVMIPLSITWPLGSILAGQFIHKLGMRFMSWLGAVFLVTGSFFMSTVTIQTSYIFIMVYTALCGLSFGILLSSLTFLASTVASHQVRGAGLSAVQLFRSLGQAVGLVLFGLFLYTNTEANQYISLLAHSLHLIFTAIALISLLLSIYILWIMKNKQGLNKYELGGKRTIKKLKQVSVDQHCS